MSEWKEYKLGEIGEVITGKTPSKKNPEQWGNNMPFVTPTDFDAYNKSILGSIRCLSEQGINAFQKKILPIDSVIVTCIGSQMGKVALNKKECVTNQQINSIIPHKEFNSNFIYYIFCSMQDYLRNLATGGSTMPIVNKSTFEQITIKAPDYTTQTAIAEILSSLDDKIELNNKINQELENLAQTLFKQWFIDFEFPNENGEPYKSSGGEMVDSELGEIPEGWEVYSMSDLLETVSKTYPLKSVEDVVFLNTGDIQDGRFLHKNIRNSGELPGQAKKSIRKNDILYSEIRPGNKRFAFVHFECSKYVVSTKLMVLRTKVEMNSLFQYFYLTQQEQIDYLQQLAESRSGTFPQITFSEVSTIKIALPNFEKINVFVDNVLEPFFSSKFNSEIENQELTNLRDTLLPKLISGELSVEELQQTT